MVHMRLPVPLATGLILVWSLGYPLGALGLETMPPFLLLAVRFALSTLVLGALAVASHATWPRGRQLAHTVVAGLLMQAVQYFGAYAGMAGGVPPAVSALVVAMNPVVTAVLGTVFLGERMTRARVLALVLGVAAVVAALGSRVLASGRLDPATLLTVVALLGLASGGIYQQRFCRGVDVRAGSTVQVASAAVPAVVVAACQPVYVHDPVKAGLVLAIMVLVNSTLGTLLLLRAVHVAGASRTSLIFSVIPSASALLSWLLLGTPPTAGVVIGLVLGAVACVLGVRAPSATPRQPRGHPAITIRTAVEEQAGKQ
jgi:drug/metabolite transporter (DMT)-like permease